MATTKTPAKKPAASKARAAIEKATRKPLGENARAVNLTADQDFDLPPGSTFRFEVSGKGERQVVMAARIQTAISRDGQFSIPPTLGQQVQDATGGINWSTALVALADYACDVLEETPGSWIIYPDSDKSGNGKLCSRMEFVKPGRRLELTIDGKMPAFVKETRRRIAVPADVRARIKNLMAPESRKSFSGVLLALAQYALEDLRKKKKRLLVLPASLG